MHREFYLISNHFLNSMRWTKGGACASVVVGFETNYAWLIPIMSWWIKKIAASASLTSWIPTSFNVWPSSQQRGTSTIDMLSIINAIVGHCRFNPTYSRLLHPVSRPPSHSRRANDRSISSVVITPPVFFARSVMGLVALYESDRTSFHVSQSTSTQFRRHTQIIWCYKKANPCKHSIFEPREYVIVSGQID